ncbi:PepSY domain-containing protein [Lentisalinibacter salinarum]|uniref:PepSY domain-containing protein n=1 Tax=Lentisalinibacter salinarum TaxID=2992239 RepID=UPI00386A08F8
MKQTLRLAPPLLFALVLGVAASAAPAHAVGPGSVLPPQSVGMAAVRDEVSLSEAVARVKREYGGRILEAETREQNGRRVHVIKVLTREGRVRTVRIPAGDR